MSLQIGYIDNDGHPKVRLKVGGTNAGAEIEIDALVDTGFTGFLMLPIALALPLGLVLIGTGDYMLADGSLITNFLARGQVTIGPSVARHPNMPISITGEVIEDETVEGIIVLAGDDPLIGMEFMRSLDKSLLIGKVVMLVDHPSDTAGTTT